ncbi:MAG: TolC family protein [Pseudomonadales bacterium]|nr:TolC family protein [Pseudomonadales bacterium]MBO6597116.1 TolC family protein [Pseudomonadales bacterium]MBO6823697.1 TolC family protein [Pseudomonadales bacterium]
MITVKKSTVGLLITLLLAGCSMQPAPITPEETRARVNSDRALMALASQPVDGPISLYEAMARALAFNLDLKLEQYKTNLAAQQLSMSRHDQLPEIVAGHISDGRSNDSGGSSRSLLTGDESLESSTSTERYTSTDDLGLSWDILDFGVSYYRAKQASDRVLLAHEQQKNVVNRILTDVQKTYWRAVSYDRLITQLESLMEEVSEKLEESRQIEARGLDAPLTALKYQRELLYNKRELYGLYEDMAKAKIELAALMNIPVDQEYALAPGHQAVVLPGLPFTPEVMENIALENRPELREVTYRKRINANEVKAALVGILPGIRIDYARNYDSNALLFNSDWTDYSARISWNLLAAYRYPDTKKVAEAQAETLDAQRLSLSAAVLTQVHVGVARYQHTKNEFLIAKDLSEIQEKIRQQIELSVKAEASSDQTLINEQMNALLTEVRYDIAHANLEGAYADLYAAMGISPALNELDTSDLQALTDSLQYYFQSERNQVK